MSKTIIRVTIILVAIYLILCYLIALIFGCDVWSQSYYLLFELCTCLCISKQGVYHCKFIKYTAYCILISDCIVCLHNHFSILPQNYIVLLQAAIITLGLSTTLTLAIRHFLRVKRLKRIWQVNHPS